MRLEPLFAHYSRHLADNGAHAQSLQLICRFVNQPPPYRTAREGHRLRRRIGNAMRHSRGHNIRLFCPFPLIACKSFLDSGDRAQMITLPSASPRRMSLFHRVEEIFRSAAVSKNSQFSAGASWRVAGQAARTARADAGAPANIHHRRCGQAGRRSYRHVDKIARTSPLPRDPWREAEGSCCGAAHVVRERRAPRVTCIARISARRERREPEWQGAGQRRSTIISASRKESSCAERNAAG